MDTKNAKRSHPLFVDKRKIQEIVARQNAVIGLVRDPSVTPEKVRAMMIADGVRPEDNIFSCGIIAARDEE